MRNPHGFPIWYELHARDADAAQDFYTRVLGWSVTPSGMPGGMDYRIITASDGGGVGGLMGALPDMPMPAGWLFYVGVDDVDSAVAQVQAGGGAVHMPATDVPGVGRMALVADPHGARFYVMRGAVDEESRAFLCEPGSPPGHAVWNELTAPDQDAALAFYATLFGWRHDGAMPMGELGEYRFVHAGPTCIGASMNAFPGAPPGWQFYFQVDDVDAAVARLTDAGGGVVQGPDQIPGGSFAVVAQDPEGTRFGFVGSRNA